MTYEEKTLDGAIEARGFLRGLLTHSAAFSIGVLLGAACLAISI